MVDTRSTALPMPVQSDDEYRTRWSTPPPCTTSSVYPNEPPGLLPPPAVVYPNDCHLIRTAPRLPKGALDGCSCYYQPVRHSRSTSLAFLPLQRSFDMESQDEEDYPQYYTPRNKFLPITHGSYSTRMGGACSPTSTNRQQEERCSAPRTNMFLPISPAAPRAVEDDNTTVSSSDDDSMDPAASARRGGRYRARNHACPQPSMSTSS